MSYCPEGPGEAGAGLEVRRGTTIDTDRHRGIPHTRMQQFKNLDYQTAKFGLNNMKTKVQPHKKGIDYHLVTGQTPNQVYWEFERAGTAAVTGKVRTID